MLTDKRVEEIKAQVIQMNLESDKYQLVHALPAIEKIIKQRVIEAGQKEFNQIRNELQKETDNDKIKEILQRGKKIRKDISQRTVKIVIDYMSQIDEGNARTLKASSNTYRIFLPESMANFRENQEQINNEKLNTLRYLMAHELGHVLLHSSLFEEGCEMTYNSLMEEEADCFAKELIKMRQNCAKNIYGHLNKPEF